MKNITFNADIMGGEPVVEGTRVSVSIILYRLRDGYTLKEIHAMYPWVSIKKLEAVLDELALWLDETRGKT